MFDFITTKLLLWVCAGLVAALVVTGSFAGCEHHNAKVARAERAAAESQRDTAIDANKSNVTTIEAQQKALEQWKALGITPGEAKAAVLLAVENHAKAEQLAAELKNAKEHDRANPDCNAILSADIERACPLVVLGLRDVARGDKNGAGGSAGPRRETAPRRAPGGLRAEVSVPPRKPEG